MTGTKLAQCLARLCRVEAFEDQLADHFDELRVLPHGLGTHYGEPQLVANLPGFDIEVVEDLDMVAQEADGHQHDRGGVSLHVQLTQIVSDVWPQPRLRG